MNEQPKDSPPPPAKAPVQTDPVKQKGKTDPQRVTPPASETPGLSG
jgi:hypothetical protein